MNPDNQNEIVDDGADDELKVTKSKFTYPDGEYEMVCVDCERDVSQAGNKMLVWSFRGPDELNNALFKAWTAITPDAAWKISEYAMALGLAKEGDTIKIGELRKNAIGRRVIGKLKVETVKGQERSNLKEVKAHPNGPGETLEKAPF